MMLYLIFAFLPLFWTAAAQNAPVPTTSIDGFTINADGLTRVTVPGISDSFKALPRALVRRYVVAPRQEAVSTGISSASDPATTAVSTSSTPTKSTASVEPTPTEDEGTPIEPEMGNPNEDLGTTIETPGMKAGEVAGIAVGALIIGVSICVCAFLVSRKKHPHRQRSVHVPPLQPDIERQEHELNGVNSEFTAQGRSKAVSSDYSDAGSGHVRGYFTTPGEVNRSPRWQDVEPAYLEEEPASRQQWQPAPRYNDLGSGRVALQNGRPYTTEEVKVPAAALKI